MKHGTASIVPNPRLLLVIAALIGMTSGHVLGALVAVFVTKLVVVPMLFPAPPAPAPKATPAKKPTTKTTKSTSTSRKKKTT